MQDAVIAGFVRTPFHPSGAGALAGIRPDDLAGLVIAELVSRTGVDRWGVDEVMFGCGYPSGVQGGNIARIAALLARLPVEVAAVTISRFGGSSMSAIHFAAGQIRLGTGEVYICGGVDSMTAAQGAGLDTTPNPRVLEAYTQRGETAENIAAQYGVSRQDQDGFAVSSQRKAAAAQTEGRFREEIVSVRTAGRVIASDGCPRPETTLQSLAALMPSFRAGGSVTVGTTAPFADGAVATLIASEAYARRNGLSVMARIRAAAAAGCPPEIMGMGAAAAAGKVLANAGLTVDDLDVVEIGEVFGSQSIACVRELGVAWDRVNIDGGAISLGHPPGAAGARITGKAAQLLRRHSGRFALACQCVGGGQGVATILESP
jgi:acetyl-CoA acyltransferase